MQIVTALIVDEIRDSASEEGRVDLIGLREDLFFDSVPVVLERLTLFVEMQIGADDRGRKHRLGFRLSDHSDKILKELPINFSLPEEFPRMTAPLDPTLFELPFERFGPHYLDMFVNGDHQRRIYLSVLPRPDYTPYANDSDDASEEAS